MNSLNLEIKFYRKEIQFHLQEAEFWKTELKKAQKLQKKYQKLKIKKGDIFLKSISKMKNINKRDVIAFILRG